MSELLITKEPKGWQLWTSPDGRERTKVGPVWPTVREASRFFDLTLAIPKVSPLREEPDGVLTDPVTFTGSSHSGVSPLSGVTTWDAGEVNSPPVSEWDSGPAVIIDEEALHEWTEAEVRAVWGDR